MRTLSLLILLFSFLINENTFAQGKDYALFFVVTDFDHWQNFPKSTEVQVRKIDTLLRENYGFETEFVLNPTMQKVLDKLEEYSQKSFGKDDQLLIYFSTHGRYKKGQTGALILKDGKLNDFRYKSWMRHPLLADLLNAIPCQHILLSLDACCSGTFGGGRSRPEKPAWAINNSCATKKKNALLYKSRLYLTSGGEERTPIESVFADKWLEALENKRGQGVFGFYQLFGVLNDAFPQPRFGDFKGHGKGDFVFVHRDKCGQIATMTDQNHWEKISQNPSFAALMEHIRKYPKCIHEAEIFKEPNKKKEEIITPTIANLPLPKGMVLVKGGTFQMGSNDGESNEIPLRSVTLSDYYIDRYEVTFDDYDAFCNATKRKLVDDKKWGRGNRPVINVNWNDAIAYCNWKSKQDHLQKVYSINGEKVTANWNANGYRLPTAAEWEFAARSRGRADKWAGNFREGSLSTYGNYNEKGKKDGFEFTAPVGSFSPNELGIYDMSGNVWEWCWDWYKYPYPSTNQTNPKGPDTGNDRVVRGGSWDYDPAFLRSAYRGRSNFNDRGDSKGFRLSRSAR